MTPVRRVRALLLTGLVGCLLLAGCRVDATVKISMADDGRGTIDVRVMLDAAAVARVEQNGRTLETAIVLDDLETAGWTVSKWTRPDAGGATIELSRAFVGEAQLAARLRELVGTTNTLGNVRVIRERTFLRTRDELSVDADLRALATNIPKDPELVASLTAAGLDPNTLEQQLSSDLQDAFRLSLSVEVPGGRADKTRLSVGEHREVTAARKQFNSGRLIVLVMAGLLIFLALLLYLSASISARRDRARRSHRTVQPDRSPLM